MSVFQFKECLSEVHEDRFEDSKNACTKYMDLKNDQQ